MSETSQSRPNLLRLSVSPTTILSPFGRQLCCYPSTRPPNDYSTFASRTLLSSCLRGQCLLTLWGPLDSRASRRGPPPQAFSSDRIYFYTLSGQRFPAPAIIGALATRPAQRKRRSLPYSKSELLHQRDAPAGPESRH